jgi:FlaA1/EpsC-like NDP-sugar epimerase
MIDDKEILISGGTGSLGKALIKELTSNHSPKGIRVYSRSEFNQWELKVELSKANIKIPIEFIIGDVRDLERLKFATKGVDIIIHTAAMKQVGACEYHPIEAIETNIEGAKNIISSALYNNVEKVINISTDKAVNPINLYGATKMVAEKLFKNASVYTGGRKPLFATCRYGNVMGSRGSVYHAFKDQAKTGNIRVNDPTMTRFFIALKDVTKIIMEAIKTMKGGEIFIPKMKAYNIAEMAGTLYPEHEIEFTQIGIGEKYHEILKNEYEFTTSENNDFYSVGDVSTAANIDDKYFASNTCLVAPTKEDIERMIGK